MFGVRVQNAAAASRHKLADASGKQTVSFRCSRVQDLDVFSDRQNSLLIPAADAIGLNLDVSGPGKGSLQTIS